MFTIFLYVLIYFREYSHKSYKYCYQKDFTFDEIKDCDEAFVTGTFSGLIPVVELDSVNMRLSRDEAIFAEGAVALGQSLKDKKYLEVFSLKKNEIGF